MNENYEELTDKLMKEFGEIFGEAGAKAVEIGGGTEYNPFKANAEAGEEEKCPCGGCRVEGLANSLLAKGAITETEKKFLLEISDAIRVFVAVGTQSMKEFSKELSELRVNDK